MDDFQIEDNQDRTRKYLRLMNPSSRLEIAATEQVGRGAKSSQPATI